MSEHAELIAKLEAASEGSRELDSAMFRALGGPLPEKFESLKLKLSWQPDGSATMPVGDMQVRYEPPAYTTSLDAVVGLIERKYPGQLPAFLMLAAHRSQTAQALALGLCVALLAALQQHEGEKP